MIYAVGVGPGDLELLTLRARRLLEEADIVAGFATVLKVVEQIGRGKRVILTYKDQEEKLDEVASLHKSGRRCVVCFMGDPSFSGHQLLARVEKACGERVEVIPGISSVQLAAAKAGLAFEDLVFVTFHKRGDLERDKGFLASALQLGRGAIVLPHPWDFMPRDIAGDLLARGVEPDREVIVFESLSLDERTWKGRLDALSGDFSDLSIVVIRP